jgi:arginyl-tRNA synthetase
VSDITRKPRPFVPDNPFDTLDQLVASAGAADELTASIPQRPEGDKDATLVVRRPQWGASDAGREAMRHIDASDGCSVLRNDGERIHVRFDDSWLELLATRLEEQAPDPLRTRTLREGESWVVNFIDPNSTKALHIGHLRNIATGQSLASVAEAGGIAVTRQIQVGDWGRSVGEAMAGYLAYGDGQTPESSGIRGDRLVGECYARYVASLATKPEESPVDAALTRERDVAHDIADQLLERCRTGDEEAVQLFEQLRGWVLEGHDATYARLGVVVDRMLFESELLDDVASMAARGLETGLFRRAESGAIVYDTGDPEYEHFLLVRPDGFPVHHLRYITTWSVTHDLYGTAHTICLSGSEWRHMVKYTEQILGALHPPSERHPRSDVVYEMVLSELGVVKSSKGNALLLDDIVDEVVECEAMDRLERDHPYVVRERLGPIVVLSHFLAESATKRMAIRPDTFVDETGPGWRLARAFARAWDPAYDGRSDPDVEDPSYRFLVVRSSLHRRLVASCIAQERVLPLMRFHVDLARWFLETPPTPRLARAMRSVLGEGLLALGLQPVGSHRALETQAVS